MCRLLDVSPSGFCERVKRPLSTRAIEEQRLLVLIRADMILMAVWRRRPKQKVIIHSDSEYMRAGSFG